MEQMDEVVPTSSQPQISIQVVPTACAFPSVFIENKFSDYSVEDIKKEQYVDISKILIEMYERITAQETRDYHKKIKSLEKQLATERTRSQYLYDEIEKLKHS